MKVEGRDRSTAEKPLQPPAMMPITEEDDGKLRPNNTLEAIDQARQHVATVGPSVPSQLVVRCGSREVLCFTMSLHEPRAEASRGDGAGVGVSRLMVE